MTPTVRGNVARERELGLENVAYRETVRVGWGAGASPEQQMSKARDVEVAASSMALEGEWWALSVPDAPSGARVEVSRARRVVRCLAPPGGRWGVATAPAATSVQVLSSGDGSMVSLRGAGDGAVSLRLNGDGLLFEFEPDGFACTSMRLATIPAGTASWSPPDVAQWATDSGDRWLASELSGRMAAGTLFGKVIALGLFLRLRGVPDGAGASEEIRALLRGEADPRLVEIFASVNTLSRMDRQRLEGALDEAVSRLEEDVARWKARDPGELPAAAALAACCRRRDEIEAVLHVLDGRVERSLIERLAILDRRALEVVVALGDRLALDDEHLRRVSDCDMDAWWGRLA